jgi:hypothetical protein
MRDLVDSYPLPEELRAALTVEGKQSVLAGLGRASDDVLRQFVLWNEGYIRSEAEKKWNILH